MSEHKKPANSKGTVVEEAGSKLATKLQTYIGKIDGHKQRERDLEAFSKRVLSGETKNIPPLRKFESI